MNEYNEERRYLQGSRFTLVVCVLTRTYIFTAHMLVHVLLQALSKLAQPRRLLFTGLLITIFLLLLSLAHPFLFLCHYDLCLRIFFDTFTEKSVTYLEKQAVPHVMKSNQYVEHGDLDAEDIPEVGCVLIYRAGRQTVPEHWQVQRHQRKSV